MLLLFQIKEKFIHGVAFGMESICFSVLDEDDTFDLDIIQGDTAVNIADVWTLSNMKSKANRQRLANVIVEATERNFI